MKERMRNAMRFYLLATQLKYKIRSGWDDKHWNINNDRRESVAEHIYGTCILAFAIYSEIKPNINIDKVIKMLVLHELGEVIIGDITPFEKICPEEKKRQEYEAAKIVIGDLVKKEEYLALLKEFEKKQTKDAYFAYLCDKLEAHLQSKVYQDMGCHNDLDNQENNITFKQEKTRQMIKDGANTPFDIWCGWNESLFSDDEDFKNIFEYIKTIDTQKDFKLNLD